MSKQSSYQLLKDIHRVTKDLEVKMDKRMISIEEKQNKIESKLDTLAGKAAMGVIILSATIGTAISLIASWIKDRFFG